jgi:hypothetical protein
MYPVYVRLQPKNGEINFSELDMLMPRNQEEILERSKL